MALDQGQWQTLSNIIIWEHASGLGWEQAYMAAADQLGYDAVLPLYGAMADIFSAVATDWDAGRSAAEAAARAQTQFAPVVFPEPPPPATPGPEPSGDLTAAQRSAKANLENFLSQMGLQSLGDFVWKEYLNDIPIEQIMLDIRGRPEYKARFPAMMTLQQKGHAMSEAEYIAYEKQVTGFMRAVGFPEGMYNDPSDFAPFLENELSVQEVAQRVQDWVNFAETAPVQNRLELQRLYGVGLGGIAAYFMDPEKALPLLEKQANAALTSVSSVASGYGELSQLEAEYVAGLGYKPEQTRQGFGQLVGQAELFNPLDRGETSISREQQLQAMFGANAGAQRQIEQRASRRAAYFQQGGGFSAGKEGIAGVGTAR